MLYETLPEYLFDEDGNEIKFDNNEAR